MKTPFDVVEIVNQKISDSGITISGNIYKYVRPSGSQAEDLVIRSESLSMDQDQLGTVDVDIYVPEHEMASNGCMIRVPGMVRMNELAHQLFDVLKEYYSGSYSYFMESVNFIIPEGQDQKCLNIKIQFRIFNSL